MVLILYRSMSKTVCSGSVLPERRNSYVRALSHGNMAGFLEYKLGTRVPDFRALGPGPTAGKQVIGRERNFHFYFLRIFVIYLRESERI